MHPSEGVWVFRWWQATPVFHAHNLRVEGRKSTFEKDGRTWDRSETTTRCGLAIYTIETWGEWPWRDGKGEWVSTTNGQWQRLDHAVLFGRPCRNCFGDGNPLEA